MNQAKGIEILKGCQIPEDMTELAERLSIGFATDELLVPEQSINCV